MFIKNYANTDLVANIKDNKITLKAGIITYVDENEVSLAQLTNMFGSFVTEITDTTLTSGIAKKTLLYYQHNIALGTLYKVRASKAKQSIFANIGTVDVRVYDGATQPTTLASMSLSTSLTNVTGEIVLSTTPVYIYVKQNTSSTTELILTGMDIISTFGALT